MRRLRRHPVVRLATIATLIAAALWLGYVIVANAVLGTNWLERRLSQTPEERLLVLGSAWTLWPGRVHVRDFRLRYGEEDLQLDLRFDRATLDIELFTLASRKLEVSRFSAEGLRFRMRRLLDDPAREPLRARALAKIEGLPETPLARPEAPDAPGGERKLWSFEIRGIDARLTELWVDEFRYAGPGRIRGAFRFAPDEEIEVRDSRVEIGPGPLGLGEVLPIATSIHGAVDGTVETLDVSDDARLGWRAFRNFTLRGSLDADVHDLGFVRAYLKSPDLALARGGGKLRVALQLDHGRFTPEARAEYRTSHAKLTAKGLEIDGDLAVALDSFAEGERRRGRLRVASRRIALAHGERAPPASVRDLDFQLVGSSIDLTRKWRARAGSVRVGALHVPDLALINAAKNGGDWRVLGGSLTAALQADLDAHGRVTGDLTLATRDASARIGKINVSGTGSARASLNHSNLRGRTGQVRNARLDLERFAFSTRTGSSGPGRLTARASLIRYRALEPRDADVHFTTAFDSADRVLDALDVASSGVPRIARWFVDLERLRVAGTVRYREGKLRVDIDRAKTDGVDASGFVEQGEQPRSRFNIDLGLFDFDVGDDGS